MRPLTPEEAEFVAALPDPDQFEEDVKAGKREPEYEFNPEFQDTIFSALMGNLEFAKQNRDIIKPDYFKREGLQIAVKVQWQYLDNYGCLPEPVIFKELFRHQVKDRDDGVILHLLSQVEAASDYCHPHAMSLKALNDSATKFAYYAHLIRISAEAHNNAKAVIDGEMEGMEGLSGVAELAAKVINKWNERDRVEKDWNTSEDVEEFRDPEWLIYKHLHQGSVVCIYGPWGSYKSFYTLDMALCIANNRPFLDRFDIKKQGKVFYYAVEGKFGTKLRKRAWEKVHDISPKDNNNIVFNFVPPDFFLESTPQAVATRMLQFLNDHWNGELPQVIVIDPLAECSTGKEDNDSFKLTVRNVKELQRLLSKDDHVPTMIIVHHAGQDVSKGPRGGTALPAGLDELWKLVKEDPQGDEVLCTCEKLKDGNKLKPYVLKAEQVLFSEKEDDNSVKLRYLEVALIHKSMQAVDSQKEFYGDYRKIINAMEMGVTGVTALEEQTGIKRTNIYTRLHAMKQKGLVTHIDKKKWELTEEGAAWNTSSLVDGENERLSKDVKKVSTTVDDC